MSSSPEIEFWFDFASTYSYLSVMRIEDAAHRSGVRIAWKPFLLGPILRGLGMDNSPFVLQKEKGAYMWRDMARQSRKYGLRLTTPTVFPRSSLLPARVALVGAVEPWIGPFCRATTDLNFAQDRDIDAPAQLAPLLTALGLDATDILARAGAEPNKLRLRAQTEMARARGVFGAPTFFVGSEMFWGNDRLDEALDFAAKQ